MIVNWIRKMFAHALEKNWYETYWAIDIHGCISRPDYRKNSKEISYYPFAKETLQYISANRPDIVLILFTSSYPDELKIYKETFEKDGINFKYTNENPEVDTANGSFGYYEKKFYFNVLLDDKAGFDPENNWYQIYSYLRLESTPPNQNKFIFTNG